MLVAGAAAAAVLTGGGGDKPAAGRQAPAPRRRTTAPQEEEGRVEGDGNGAGSPGRDQPTPTEEQQPAQEQPAGTGSGAQLNDQGFRLMQQGQFAQAVPILQKAVASYPEDSQDINYAYALFNLGKSLNRSGRSDEAISYLERRLRFPSQRATVQKELDDARRKARG